MNNNNVTMRVVLVSFLFFALFSACSAVKEQGQPSGQFKTAAFAAGCFWSVEAVYERIRGVDDVVSGYAGGTISNPTDKEVNSETTGHAETILITYDTTQISYERLLDIFWKAHDPTTLNRQGGDVGTQYRSVIFYDGEVQKTSAERSKQQAQKLFKNRIVTELQPLKEFYTARKFHQDYFNYNRESQYSKFVIQPKLKQLGLEE